MTTVAASSSQWLVFELNKERYGFSIDCVKEMVPMTGLEHRSVPSAPEYVVGVVNLRGNIVPLMDLRVMLGMPPANIDDQAIIEHLHAREEDHVNWLNELRACVEEDREFKLATDPHKCAFGKWYDRVRNDPAEQAEFTRGCTALSALLGAFDEPHRRIHAVADEVTKLVREGHAAQAREVIDRTESRELSSMIELFAHARQLVREARQQLAMVLELDNKPVGMLVDSVDTVLWIDDDVIEPLNGMMGVSSMAIGVARIEAERGGLVTLLDVGRWLATEQRAVSAKPAA